MTDRGMCMYQGKNPSALRSQAWLNESLFALMETKPYLKITVKEIAEKCNLSRQTFYQVFASKDDVVTYAINQKLHGYLDELIHHDQPLLTQDFVDVYLDFATKNHAFIAQLFHNELDLLLIRSFQSYLQQFKTHFHHQDDDVQSIEYKATFIAYGLVGILSKWFRQGQTSVAVIREVVSDLMRTPFY